MNGIFKDKKEEEELGGLDFEIPDTSNMLQKLKDAEFKEVQREHFEIREKEKEDEKQRKGNAKKRQRPKGGAICYCMVEGCTIGPFVERNS